MWHLTNEKSFKNKLHDMNNTLRDKEKTIEEMLKKLVG